MVTTNTSSYFLGLLPQRRIHRRVLKVFLQFWSLLRIIVRNCLDLLLGFSLPDKKIREGKNTMVDDRLLSTIHWNVLVLSCSIKK